jgi:hypothetical protein
MDYEQAVQRLYYHANLTEPTGEGQSSFIEALLEARERDAVPNLREQTADIIACLEVVNRHVNGETPSASVSGKERDIDRRVAYAMSAVVTSGIEHLLALTTNPVADQSSVLALGVDVWRVSCAWEAVLAGDIDSLSEHVELEKWGAEIEPHKPTP